MLVREYMTWSGAQRYCREHHTDLASVRNQAENQAVTNVSGGNPVWIGLNRTKLWSDGSSSSFRFWAHWWWSHHSGETCTSVSFSDSGKWTYEDCGSRLPFFCYDGQLICFGMFFLFYKDYWRLGFRHIWTNHGQMYVTVYKDPRATKLSTEGL